MIHIIPSEKRNCCGCNGCVQICPQKCISMVEDSEGFRYPRIDTDICINCGLCEKVCPILNKKVTDVKIVDKYPKALGGWHKEEKVRSESSSGGAFTLFAEYIIREGGIVYGCTLNKELQALHVGIEKLEELKSLRGSKYVQSEIGNVYLEIKDHLLNGRKVLFVGAPCQCAGLYTYLNTIYDIKKSRKDNLYVCDFICHGVPSPKVFASYIKFLQEKYQDTIKTFLFRNKDKGWHPSGLQMGTRIDFDSGMSVRVAPAFRDAYMNGFLDDIYLRPSCYDCEFKDLSKYYTDITIADFWGVTKVDNMLHDGKGTSLVLLHNRHGESLFDVVKENFFYKEVDINKALKKNKSMLHSAAKNPIRARFFYDYQNDSFEKVRRKYMNAFKWAFHKGIKTFWKYIRQLIIGVGTPILSIFDQKWSTEKWDAFFQFVKFAFVGVSNTVVSYVINITTLFLLRGFGMKFDYVIANLTAFTLSVLWSYHWNSTYVFHPNQYSKGERVRTLLKTYASYACSGIFLNNILATVWIQGFGVSKYISPVLNLPFSMTVNFFMQKLWAYKDRKVENVD